MVLQTGPHLRVAALGDAELVLAGPHGLAGFFLDFHELFGLRMANRAFCGRVLAFVDVSAHEASEFLFHVGYPFSVVLNNSIYKDRNNPLHLQQRPKRCNFEKKSSSLCNSLADLAYIFAEISRLRSK